MAEQVLNTTFIFLCFAGIKFPKNSENHLKFAVIPTTHFLMNLQESYNVSVIVKKKLTSDFFSFSLSID